MRIIIPLARTGVAGMFILAGLVAFTAKRTLAQMRYWRGRPARAAPRCPPLAHL